MASMPKYMINALQHVPPGNYAIQEVLAQADEVACTLRDAHQRRTGVRIQDLAIENDVQLRDLGTLVMLDMLMTDALKKRPAHVMKSMGEIHDLKEYIAECNDAYDRGLPVLQPRPVAQAAICQGPALSLGNNLYVAPFTSSMRKRALSRIWSGGALTGAGAVAYYGFDAESLAWGFVLASGMELGANALTIIASATSVMKNPYLQIADAIDEHARYVAAASSAASVLKVEQSSLRR